MNPCTTNAPTVLERPSLTEPIIGAAIVVHKTLGRGLSSHIYRRALALELTHGGSKYVCQQEHEVDVHYRGCKVGQQRIDLVAISPDDETVLIEVKHFDPSDAIRLDLARAQVVTYLAAAKVRYGLVLNFGGVVIRSMRVLNPELRGTP